MFDFSAFSLPVSIFLAAFGAFLLFFVIYSFFNFYHLMKYGVYGFGLYLIVTIFTGGTILLASGSFFLLADYDWTYPISLKPGYFENVIDLDSFDSLEKNLFPSL